MRTRYALIVPALCLALLASVPQARAGEAPAATPAERLSALPEGDARAAFVLALEFAAEGHARAAEQAHAHVSQIEPGHVAARRALRYERVGDKWLRGKALLAAKGLVADKGTVRLAEAVVKAPSKKTTSVQTHPTVDAQAAYALHLSQALRGSTSKRRAAAVAALGRAENPETARLLGRALWHRSDDIAVHAAEALIRLGQKSGIAQLAARLRGNDTVSTRAYFSQLKQVPFIQDFDTEVG